MLVLAYLLPGLIGHDPWKQDETYIFGMVDHLLRSGDWVVPMVAGEPFMEKPPLYYWVAAGFAWLCSPWLPLHDGARLATGFFMMITSTAVGWTTRQWWGRGYGRYGVFALLGCLGIVYYGHLMLTDVPLLTGFALASCGFVLARTRAMAGGLLLGVGVGVGFLAKGVLAPGVLGLTAMLLPCCFATWRRRSYFRAMAIALFAALPGLLIWPIALYWRSPPLFMDWFWLNNVGRFVGFSVPALGAAHSENFWSETLPYFTFPALPLALITLWRERGSILNNAALQFSVVLFGVLMIVLGLSASARPNYALPLLLPICLLAAPATVSLTPRIDRWWDWSARALFGLLAIAVWLVWGTMQIRSTPIDWPFLGRYLPLNFVPPLDFDALVIAPLLTLLAVAVVWRQPKAPGRGIICWVTGLALCWSLVSTLWLEWIDYAKSYRSVFVSMQSALPKEHRCIASRGLGESERAMLRYFLGFVTYKDDAAPTAGCDLLLVDGIAESPPADIDPRHWNLVWEGARPGDKRERLWLFSDAGAAPSLAARQIGIPPLKQRRGSQPRG
jgi:4-amino-4-deoxy-L-arabinose transferase-like glycosyltransferase